MKRWTAALLFIASLGALFGALRVGAGDPVLPAHEADALAKGVVVAEHLTGGHGSLRERLQSGFTANAGNPRVGMLPPEHRYRHAVVDAPTATWAAALGVMLAPTSESATNLERAATGAALLVALALTLLAAAGWRRRDRASPGGPPPLAAVVGALVPPALLLALPGVAGAAHAAGAGASAILVMTLLALAVGRLLAASAAGRGGAAWPVALAYGLALGLHPGAVWLIVPIFVSYAVAARRRASATAVATAPAPPEGELPLPVAPIGLFLIPVVALVALVALWPALWTETGKRLVAWMTDSFYMFNPSYEVAGVAFDQARDRAAMGWTGVVQWVGFTPPPILLAWFLGVWSLVRGARGRRWPGRDLTLFALLAHLTLLVVGATDGGLFGSRLDLLVLTWVPTALVAAAGVNELAVLLVGRLARGDSPGPKTIGRAHLAVAALVLAVPVVLGAAGAPTSPVGRVGAELTRPVPLAVLARVAADDPDAFIHITPSAAHWRPAVDAARDHAELRLHWAEPAEARWLLVAGPATGPLEDAARGGERVWSGDVAGVAFTLFRQNGASPEP